MHVVMTQAVALNVPWESHRRAGNLVSGRENGEVWRVTPKPTGVACRPGYCSSDAKDRECARTTGIF